MTDIKIPVRLNGHTTRIPLNTDYTLNTILTILQSEDDRYRHLQDTEWQRWIPGFGFYRFIRDISTDDQMRLNAVHSDAYQMALSGYIGLQVAALVTGVAVGLQQLVERLM